MKFRIFFYLISLCHAANILFAWQTSMWRVAASDQELQLPVMPFSYHFFAQFILRIPPLDLSLD